MKALIVDDDPLVRTATRIVLQQLEPTASILEAGTCSDGLALVALNPDLGLVILDMKLPDASGLDALVGLRKSYPDLPIVVVSGCTDRNVAIRALELGARGFFAKTIPARVLVNSLRDVISGA